MKDQYDHVINSHHDYRGFGAPLADYVVDQALECMKKIVDGTAEIRGDSRSIAAECNENGGCIRGCFRLPTARRAFMRQDKTPFEKDGKIFLQLDCEKCGDLSGRT